MSAYESHRFLLALIIPLFAFVINLALRLFTFYTFLLLDGKRAPTVNGRGSPPRSRTGCDIFSFDSHVDCDLNPKRVAFEK